MDRSTRDNVVQQLATRGTGTDCWTETQPLPFDTDSRDWHMPGSPLSASRERLTQLVRTIEAEVIPRLVEAHRPDVHSVPSDRHDLPSGTDIQAFVQTAIGRESGPVFAHVDALIASGLPVENVFMDLLAPAARFLGDLWDNDRCDFTDVTVAVGRMQQVLRDLSPAFGSLVEYPVDARRILLAPAPSDQHTFGLAMVADFFRRAGWEVVGGTAAPQAEIGEQVAAEWFDVVGFSVGTDTRVDWLKASIAAVRVVSRNTQVGVMVGGPILTVHPDLAERLGADVGATDGTKAPAQAEELLAARARRARIR